MDVVVHIPDELAEPLKAHSGDLSRRALEALALEEYRAERLSKAQLRRLLGFETRYELDGFLKEHHVWPNVSAADVRRVIEDVKSLGL